MAPVPFDAATVRAAPAPTGQRRAPASGAPDSPPSRGRDRRAPVVVRHVNARRLEDLVDERRLCRPGGRLEAHRSCDGHELVTLLAIENRAFELLLSAHAYLACSEVVECCSHESPRAHVQARMANSDSATGPAARCFRRFSGPKVLGPDVFRVPMRPGGDVAGDRA